MRSTEDPGHRERSARHERFRRIDAAFHDGDLEALRAAVGDPAIVPNGTMPLEIGSCLVYAIYHSPIAFIRTLLEIGAEPNPAVEDGFPPLIAALTTARSRPGSQARPDALEVLALLLDAGSDPDQRGINDYTPLHWAIGDRNEDAVRLLLERGADPSLRTRIDDCETPRELAAAMGETGLAELLRQAEGSRSAPPSQQP